MRNHFSLSLLLFSALTLFGCAATRHLDPAVTRSLMTPLPQTSSATYAALQAPLPEPAVPACGKEQLGRASYYHAMFDGRKTANGETFSNQMMTAAHRTLEFGTRVRVTNLSNLKSVIVTINDRGPYVGGRIIDLSRRAASALGFVQKGLAKVRVETLASRS